MVAKVVQAHTMRDVVSLARNSKPLNLGDTRLEHGTTDECVGVLVCKAFKAT